VRQHRPARRRSWTSPRRRQLLRHRQRIIFDANIRTANAAGQWQRIARTAAVLPYLQYQHTTSQEPREEHWAWADVPVVLRWDDPWWDTHFPPNGWQCKCWVLQIDEEDARALGWRPSTKAPADDLVPWFNARTGETDMVPEGIDPGWQTNPGKTRASLLDALFNNKLEEVEPAIRATVLKDLSDGWLFRQITEAKISDRPNTPKPRPFLKPEVIDAMQGKRGAASQVAAPAGHLAEAIQERQGWKSGVVWLDPQAADDARRLAGKAGIDWRLLPRVLDEGAIVRHSDTKDWITVYRQIDGQWYAADVMLRDVAMDGVKLDGGPRLRLESFRKIDPKTVEFAIKGAGSDLLRGEAAPSANLYKTKPIPPGWPKLPRPTGWPKYSTTAVPQPSAEVPPAPAPETEPTAAEPGLKRRRKPGWAKLPGWPDKPKKAAVEPAPEPPAAPDTPPAIEPWGGVRRRKSDE
jgi:hypothetical protein